MVNLNTANHVKFCKRLERKSRKLKMDWRMDWQTGQKHYTIRNFVAWGILSSKSPQITLSEYNENVNNMFTQWNYLHQNFKQNPIWYQKGKLPQLKSLQLVFSTDNLETVTKFTQINMTHQPTDLCRSMSST